MMKVMRTKRLAVAFVALVLAASHVLLPAQTAYALTDGQNESVAANVNKKEDKKVWVCKYVGTPYVNETLKGGKNPISVSANTLWGFNGTFPATFPDAQGSSVAIAYDNGGPAPDISQCPAPRGPAAYPVITVSPVCGSNNDVITWTGDHVVVLSDSGWVANWRVITWLAVSPYRFADGGITYTKTFTDKHEACPRSIAVPAAPTPNDPCGLNNASWVKPADTDQLHWSIVNGELIVETKAGYVFTDGTTSHNYGSAQDSSTLCRATAQPVTYNDACRTQNDTYTIPDVQGVIYRVNGAVKAAGTYAATGTVTITAEAAADYELSAPYSLTIDFTNTPCQDETVTICHRTNSAAHPYDKITVSVDSVLGEEGHGTHTGPIAYSVAYAQWLRSQDIKWGDIIPPIGDDFAGLNWTATGQALLANNCQPAGPVTPSIDITSTQECLLSGASNGTITITVHNPNAFQTVYKIVLGGTPAEVTAPANGTASQTFIGLSVGSYGLQVFERGAAEDGGAIPAGFKLDTFTIMADEIEYTWTKVYDGTVVIDQCPSTVVTATAPSGVDACGLAHDTFTIPSTEHVTYYVDGKVVAAGTHSTDGRTSIVITAQASDPNFTLGDGTSSWTLTFTDTPCQTPCVPLTGAIAFTDAVKVANTCPVPGNGGGAVTSVKPAELPKTGASGAGLGLFLTTITALLTYAVVYFAQPKRKFEQN